MDLDLNEILSDPPSRRTGSKPVYSPEVAAARHREQSNRNSTAQAKARQALTYLHKDEYDALYQQARAQVYAEAGPLPGDEE